MWVGFQILAWFADLPGTLEIGVGAIFMSATMLSIAVYATNGARKQWLRDYWRKNVVVYVARFYRTRIGPERQLLYMIRTTRQSRWVSQRPNEIPLSIDLPLNGSWGRILCTDDAWRQCLQGWSVRLRAILYTSAVMVEIRKHNRFWDVNECIVTDIGNALRYLEEIATDPGANVSSLLHRRTLQLDDVKREREALEQRITTLFGILHDVAGNQSVNKPMHEWMETQLRHLIRERDDSLDLLHKVFLILRQVLGETSADPEWKDHVVEVAQRLGVEYKAAREDRDEARQECEEAVKFVDGLAEEIEQGGRLSGTIEALRLLDRMLNWLCWAVVSDSSEHRAMQDRLAVIRKKLAEKMKRDRTQHGRRSKQPGAPAEV